MDIFQMMTRLHVSSVVAGVMVAAVLATPRSGVAAELPEVELVPVYTNIRFQKPLMVAIPPDGSQRRFLVQQGGKVLILPDDRNASEAPVFLDVSDRNLYENFFEEGLLSIAFHPDFKDNQRFYIYYSQQGPKRSVVSEFHAKADDPNAADMASERSVMEIPQPFWNHNSGNMLFGPDGFLYICLGDGGRANDPFHNAQDLTTLLGSILRIDVDSRTGNLPYGIPTDNPFLGRGFEARPEIWAYGLRNPWGVAFDGETGLFWCADVGQNKFEEINLIEKGGNYGWNYREGLHAFDLNKETVPEGAEFIDPIHEYGRTEGISVTGGLVYRGNDIPGLKGHYLYSDWFSGTIWALKLEEGQATKAYNEAVYKKDVTSPIQIGGFSEEVNGELLVFSLDGQVLSMRPKSAATAAAE